MYLLPQKMDHFSLTQMMALFGGGRMSFFAFGQVFTCLLGLDSLSKRIELLVQASPLTPEKASLAHPPPAIDARGPG